jgi:hypothetical protein
MSHPRFSFGTDVMDALAFVEKWRKSTRTERSASQEHFLDLCELFKHPRPGDVDAKGTTFTAEMKVRKGSGKLGYADFFKKGAFAWEYKRKGTDLNEAFNQLLQYSGDLGNPPLLIASDMDRIEIRTRFTGFPTTVHTITLADFTKSSNLETLRRVFFDPESLRPEKTIEKITEEAAEQLAEIAPTVQRRHDDPTRVAHYLNRLIFCLFAEDVGLIPGNLFTRIIEKYQARDARKISHDIGELFKAMARGGDVYGESIPFFDGNLFDELPTLELNGLEIEIVHKAAALDWSEMDPSIFGTLFERVMDPNQRSQLGAHYTSFTDIATLVEPVVIAPLRREWEACRERIGAILPDAFEFEADEVPTVFTPPSEARKTEARALVTTFLKRLRAVRVLDPACGSGNFLYVALRKLKDLEYEVLVFCRHHDLQPVTLQVGPHQLRGIELNPYAHDLAQMTVWIGMIQWHRSNGFPYNDEPILQPLDTIECKDAILDLTHPEFPAEPDWPEADFIIGNPPFLGGKKLRTELGDSYVDRLFDLWRENVRPEADLCCYWFEKARRQIEIGKCKRAGLLATQGIRGGANRGTLHRIKQTGEIFFAESDRPWILAGATVHVSMVGFDDGSETGKMLDGTVVSSINGNLTSAADITQAQRLTANLNTGFMGDTKGGSFDILEREAVGFMDRPNPNGRPNSDVIVPWINGLDVTRRNRHVWIIDFGVNRSMTEASGYERPFEYIKENVRPDRQNNKRQAYKERWWIHVEARPAMLNALARHSRFIVTARVAKHRLFVWMESPTLPDCQVIAFARSDDYFFGVIHSRSHEVWARAQGTQVRERESGFRYTPTTCFETFPFPEATAAQRDTIAKAAKRLDELRSNWLNPPEWQREEVLEFPGSVDGPWSRFVHTPNAKGIGTVRYPRLVPKSAYVYDLAKRTLTNLYNERPTWLDLAHRALDEAAFAAYGWNPSMSDEEILSALLDLNLERVES